MHPDAYWPPRSRDFAPSANLLPVPLLRLVVRAHLGLWVSIGSCTSFRPSVPKLLVEKCYQGIFISRIFFSRPLILLDKPNIAYLFLLRSGPSIEIGSVAVARSHLGDRVLQLTIAYYRWGILSGFRRLSCAMRPLAFVYSAARAPLNDCNGNSTWPIWSQAH